ncbi:keratin, type I cuticular Ha7-like [Molossus molossus]|uniref:keratin, type I cuticular Ha7-like n=1 Tax=Molossus molossus TaxID=27622 RepID=UPI001747B9EF|nr:keratin, type I cuticular Ha7-like [Molossus molossus]
MASFYISPCKTPGDRDVCVSSLDVGPAMEANAACLGLSASLAHASRVRVGTTPLGRPNLCLPHSCLTACPLPGTCHIPGSVGSCGTYGEGTLNGHEKETMQFLNDRLANYLEKVRQLERENAELETRIREWSQCHETTVCPNYQGYFRSIEELQQKILCSKAENARLITQIDNAKLAADDFRIKHESEHALRLLVEADMCGMHKLLDDLSLAKADLEAQQESLKEEQLCLKSNHEQEVNILKCQLGDKLRIELDTEPTVDLSRVLDNMRCQYEAMVETNRRDVEQWFQAQSEGISLQATSCCEELQCCQSEILELRCTVNALEVERQAQHHLKDCLQNSLCESEARFGTELAQMQCLISTVEEQLAEIRADLERQNQEYQVLLDIRARLEGEIATYRHLLESEDCKLPCNPCSTPASCTLRPSCAPPACASCSPCLPGAGSLSSSGVSRWVCPNNPGCRPRPAFSSDPLYLERVSLCQELMNIGSLKVGPSDKVTDGANP